MTTSLRRPLGAVAVVAVLVTVGAVTRPASSHAHRAAGSVTSVATTTAVCPNVTGNAGLATTMTVADVGPNGTRRPTVSYSPLIGGRPRSIRISPTPTAAVSKTTPYASVAVTAEGAGAGRVVADQVALAAGGLDRAFTDTACAAPGTDWWFAGADGRIGASDTLFLANPGDAVANLRLAFWSAKGPLAPPGATGIVLPAHSVLRRGIAEFAPDAAAIAVHVHADSGTVTAALYDRRTHGVTPHGGDWIPPTLPPTRRQVVAGFAPVAGAKGLALANPGSRDATATLRVVTAHGSFAPAGAQTLVVPAGSGFGVDLSRAIGSDPASVVVTSDQPLLAEGVSIASIIGKFSELAWVPAQLPLQGPAAVPMTVPPFGQQTLLLLSAPEGAAQVRVTAAANGASAVVHVGAGRSVAADLRALLHAGTLGPGPVVLTALAGGPAYAVRVLYALGAHGPLLAASAPIPFPADIVLPAVVPDVGAGAP